MNKWFFKNGYWLLVLLFASFRENENQTCLDEVKIICHRLSEEGQPADKMYYMNYSIRTVFKDSLQNESRTIHVKMLLKDRLMQVQNEEMEIYQDEKEVFTVLPKKKLVIRADTPDRPDPKKRKKQVQFLQDTLFAFCRVSSCTPVRDGEGLKRVVLNVSPKGQETFKVSRLEILMDPVKQTLKYMRVNHAQSENGHIALQDLAYTEYTIHEFSRDYKNGKLNNKLEHQFMRSSTQLAIKYQGFELIDNRNKPKDNKSGDARLLK